MLGIWPFVLGSSATCLPCKLCIEYLADRMRSPTLMGSSTGPNIADAGWQVRVIDTILQNTYQIFDDD